ncbi:MAG: hypothetical protein IPN16_09590 [Gemmatimonadetes bacterium]|nr:hypothetical protein [Gemmatimonadota bacterium]
MTVAYISHADCGRHDTGWHHPEHVGRLRAIPRALRNDFDLYQAIEHLESRHATADELAIAHDPDYVERVRQLVEQGGGRLDPDTVASEGSWDAARAACGAVLDGVDMAFDGRAVRSFAAVRPPGITRCARGRWASASSATWRSPRTTPAASTAPSASSSSTGTCTTGTGRRRWSRTNPTSTSSPCTSGPGTRGRGPPRIAGRTGRCGTSPWPPGSRRRNTSRRSREASTPRPPGGPPTSSSSPPASTRCGATHSAASRWSWRTSTPSPASSWSARPGGAAGAW